MNKTCTKCKQSKSLEENFYKFKISPDGYRTYCKGCMKGDGQKEKIRKPKPVKLVLNEVQYLMFKTCGKCKEEKIFLDFKESPKDTLQGCLSCYCKYCIIESSKEYYLGHKDSAKAYQKQYVIENREKIRAYRRDNIQVKWRNKCRIKILRYLKFNSDAIIHKFIGCTSNDLKRKLAAQFKADMNWDNYGEVWNIDHIIPLCKYDLTIEQNRFDSNHWSNLRPAYIKDNNTMTEEQRAMSKQGI